MCLFLIVFFHSFNLNHFLICRQGLGLDAVKKLLEPATSISVATRIAGNLARASIRLDGPDAIENGAYWSAVRRHLENVLEKESAKEMPAKETPAVTAKAEIDV